MGAKSSKRGSYSVQKREKRKKGAILEERASSFISLTQAQIYEDAINTPLPLLSQRPASFDSIIQNGRVVPSKKISTVFNTTTSERDDYSNPDDEKIYDNILNEPINKNPPRRVSKNSSNFEEQVERKDSIVSSLTSSQIQGNQRRRTWSQSENLDEQQYFDIEEEAYSISSSENQKDIAGQNGPGGNWKEILNDVFWTEGGHGHQVEKTEYLENATLTKNPRENVLGELQPQTSEENVSNIIYQKERNTNNFEIQESIQEVQNQLQVEPSNVNSSNEERSRQNDALTNGILTVEGTFNSLSEFKDNDLKQHNEEQVEFSPAETKQENVQQEENLFEEQQEILIEQEESSSPGRKKKVTFEDEEQLELTKINSNNEDEQEDAFEEQREAEFSDSEEQVEISISRHPPLSKSISDSSDVYYEDAAQIEESESEEQELFYDAEAFEDSDSEAQVEVQIMQHEILLETTELKQVENLTIKGQETAREENTRNLEEDYREDLIDDFVELQEDPNETEEYISHTYEEVENERDSLLHSSKIIEMVEPNYFSDEQEYSDSLVDDTDSKFSGTLSNLNENNFNQNEYNESESSQNFEEISTFHGLTDHKLTLVNIINEESDESDLGINYQVEASNSRINEDRDLMLITNIDDDQLKNVQSLKLGENPDFVTVASIKEESANQIADQQLLIDLSTQDLFVSNLAPLTPHQNNILTTTIAVENNLTSTDSISTIMSKASTEEINENNKELILATEQNKSLKLPETEKNSFGTTPEELAHDQMKLWEEHEEAEIEEAIVQINIILISLEAVKNDIDSLGSSEKDKNSHAEMYPTLMKIMRDVNSINNHNFNERVIELQHRALNEVHSCLKQLQTR